MHVASLLRENNQTNEKCAISGPKLQKVKTILAPNRYIGVLVTPVSFIFVVIR